MIRFYKVIVLKVGTLETVIADERHFGSEQDAQKYIESIPDDMIAIMLTM